jgi:hypothetical protein
MLSKIRFFEGVGEGGMGERGECEKGKQRGGLCTAKNK